MSKPRERNTFRSIVGRCSRNGGMGALKGKHEGAGLRAETGLNAGATGTKPGQGRKAPGLTQATELGVKRSGSSLF